MKSSNGNIFRVTGHFCAGNLPVAGDFPAQRPVRRSFDVSLICAWINGSVNNRKAGDLRRHRASLMKIPGWLLLDDDFVRRLHLHCVHNSCNVACATGPCVLLGPFGSAPNTKTYIFLISSFSCLCPIHWSQVLSRWWRCSWSSTDRRCPNYIWGEGLGVGLGWSGGGGIE